MNNAQLMRELKESEEIKQVINHLTQDIIDLYHIQIPIQDIDEAVKMFGGRVEEDREKYCKYCDFISKERDSFAIYISPYYKSERRKMIIAQQLGHFLKNCASPFLVSDLHTQKGYLHSIFRLVSG